MNFLCGTNLKDGNKTPLLVTNALCLTKTPSSHFRESTVTYVRGCNLSQTSGDCRRITFVASTAVGGSDVGCGTTFWPLVDGIWCPGHTGILFDTELVFPSVKTTDCDGLWNLDGMQDPLWIKGDIRSEANKYIMQAIRTRHEPNTCWG